jgi:hypothetical protein
MDQELKTLLTEMEARIKRNTEEVETRLLTEFWKWARTADARYRQDHLTVGALDSRVQAVEDRISEIERRRAS